MAQATDSPSAEGAGSGSEKFIDKLKDDSLERVKTTQRSAADQLEGVAAAIDRAGGELDESQPTLAHYAAQLASGVSSLATRLKQGSLDELTSDAQRFARSNPGLFLLGSVGLGMVLARFLKASATERTASGTQNLNSDSSHGLSSDSSSGELGAGSQSARRTFTASPEDSGVFDEPYAATASPDLDRGEGLEDSEADSDRAGNPLGQGQDFSSYDRSGGRNA